MLTKWNGGTNKPNPISEQPELCHLYWQGARILQCDIFKHSSRWDNIPSPAHQCWPRFPSSIICLGTSSLGWDSTVCIATGNVKVAFIRLQLCYSITPQERCNNLMTFHINSFKNLYYLHLFIKCYKITLHMIQKPSTHYHNIIKTNSSFFNYINWNSFNVLFMRYVKLCGVTKVQRVHFMPSISLKVLNIWDLAALKLLLKKMYIIFNMQ